MGKQVFFTGRRRYPPIAHFVGATLILLALCLTIVTIVAIAVEKEKSANIDSLSY
jgi:hypothetical protein